MVNNFECIFLSVNGDCMDNDFYSWEKCKDCDKPKSCDDCIWSKLDKSYCKKCSMREDF